jgi:hypothetical protein
MEKRRGSRVPIELKTCVTEDRDTFGGKASKGIVARLEHAH